MAGRSPAGPASPSRGSGHGWLICTVIGIDSGCGRAHREARSCRSKSPTGAQRG